MTTYTAASGKPIVAGRTRHPNALLDIIAAAPGQSWLRVDENSYTDAWPESDLLARMGSGVSDPAKIIKAWSGIGWDSKRHRLWLWGGGHNNSNGNELYYWDAVTRQWGLAYYPSDVLATTDGWLDTVDGAWHSPVSSHTYKSNSYLPTLDRFLIFGGAAAISGGSLVLREPPGAPTYIRSVGAYTCQLNLAGQGMVAGITASNVHRASSVGLDLAGAQAWEMRDWANPANQNATFGVRTNSGVAVRVESGVDTAYAMFSRQLWRIRFAADWRDDQISKVGAYAVGVSTLRSVTLHDTLNLFVSTGDATEPFTFWDLDYAGPSNNDKAVFMNTLTGDGAASFATEVINHCGIEYDPIRNKLMLWPWGGRVYAITPPTAKPTPATGWTVEIDADQATDRPMTKAEAEAINQDAHGVVGKWRYAPDLDAFIGLQHITQGHVWVYKPAAWQDPRG